MIARCFVIFILVQFLFTSVFMLQFCLYKKKKKKKKEKKKATCVINYYRSSAQLFVGGETLLSAEGTTQGDPLSMAIYALGTLPLVSNAKTADVTQAWFADDASAADKLIQLHKWWTILVDGTALWVLCQRPQDMACGKRELV